jgi:hypothetical protein
MTPDWSMIFREFTKKYEEYYGIQENASLQILNKVKDLKGSNSLFKNLSSKDKGQTDDLLAELRYISLFLDCGWHVEIIQPSDKPTPDLKVTSDEFSSIVEIKHIRLRNSRPSPIKNIEQSDFLELYGDFPRAEKIVRNKMLGKKQAIEQIYQFSDRNPEDIPIIALWSSDGGIEEIEVESSLKRIVDEIREQKPDFPNGILIFGNGLIYRHMTFIPYPLHINGTFNPILKGIANRISLIR